MRNKLTDLNNHLFEQLERINDQDLTDDELAQEMKRAKTVAMISNQIVNNARVQLDAMKEFGGSTVKTTQHFLGEGNI